MGNGTEPLAPGKPSFSCDKNFETSYNCVFRQWCTIVTMVTNIYISRSVAKPLRCSCVLSPQLSLYLN